MHKEWQGVAAALCLLLTGCQQLPISGSAAPAGKFIDSPRARPLALQPKQDNPWLNNLVVDTLAGTREEDRVRGFGQVDLTRQMAQVDSFQAPALQAYCERVLEKLLGQWPHVRPAIRVRFSASENFGAQATADSIIYLNLGALQAIESEDELAAMLGHEAAHLLLGHLDREHFFNQQKKLLDASVTLANLSVTLSGMESQKSGASRTLVFGDPQAVGKSIQQSTLTGTLLKAVSDNFWNSSWNRAQEDEADLLSVDLLSRAGYSPRGAIYGVQRLQSFAGTQQNQLERYQAQQRQLFNRAYQKKGLSGMVEQGINSGLMSAQLLATDVWKEFGKTHQLPAEREKQLMQYLAEQYRVERRRRPNLAQYQQQLLGGESGRLLADHVLINRASKALEQGDIQQAMALAEQVAAGPAGNSLRAQTLQFVLAVQQNRYDEALASLERVPDSEWQYASLSSYDQIISLSLSLDRTVQAERYLLKGQAHWGLQWMAPLEILVHLQGKRVAQAQQAYRTCQGSTSKSLLAQCEQYIGAFKPQEAPSNPLKQLGLPDLPGLPSLSGS
ncbi:MAG: M48 family metalloprotease [Pseudomonas sp.]